MVLGLRRRKEEKKLHDMLLRMRRRFQAHWIFTKAHFEEDNGVT